MRLRPTIMVLSIICAGIFVAVAVMAPGAQRSAHVESAFPLIVRGYVRDAMGVPVPGADVEVSVKQGSTVRASYTTTTNSTGGYSQTFAGEYWDVGDTILVIAGFGGDSAENSTTANEDPIQYVDVALTIVIPEFSDVGKVLSIAGTLGAFMMVFFARRKKTR